MVNDRSGFTVRNSGFSGRGCCGALVEGSSTAMSTVASGAATMNMISSTSITSMNGVTLISWTSLSSSLPWSRRTLMRGSRSLGRGAQRRLARHGAAIEVAADQAEHCRGGIGELGAIARDGTGEHVVDHDRRDRG